MTGVNLAPRLSRKSLRDAERSGKDQPASHVGTFRKDIQGLRAIAVGLVLLGHAKVPGFGGGFVGVDVFFVLSGFLITGIIIRELDKTGTLRIWNFWARRVRRLLPAASLVLVFVTFGTLLTLPVSRWVTISGDILASAFYYVNWRFALNSIDYMAADSAASPVQHYWSLAIEEQFYVILPIIILLIAVVIKWVGKRKISPVHLIVVLSPAVLISFVWSIHYTATTAAPAYFVSTTRAWEMGIGALLALVASYGVRMGQRQRTVMAWTGVAGIVGAALLINPGTPYPGYAALLPVTGTVLVLLAGTDATRGPISAMTNQPAQFIGDISYSLYLWHWPVVVFLPEILRPETKNETIFVGVLAVLVSVIPAYLSYRFVEKPIHKSSKIANKRGSAVVVLALCLLTAVVCSVIVMHRYDKVTEEYEASLGETPGAGVLGLDVRDISYQLSDWQTEVLVPNPAKAKNDRQRATDEGCHLDQVSPDPVGCQAGPTDSNVSVVLIGDSHAAQWQTALDIIAVEQGWDFNSYTKSACLWAFTEVWNSNVEGPYVSCTEWSHNLTELLTADPPDYVLVSQSVYAHASRTDGSRDLLVAGVVQAWQPLLDAGSKFVVIADTPRMGQDVAECVEQNNSDLSECSTGLAQGVEKSGQQLQWMVLEALGHDIEWVDMNPWVCPGGDCLPAIGGVLTFRDAHHLTATYVTTLAPALTQELLRVM